MKSLDALRKDLVDAGTDPDFLYEQLLIDVNECILAAMEREGVRRSDLANRLGTSRAYVTKLLSGPENLTLRTLVRLAHVLGSRVEFSLAPLEAPRTSNPRKQLDVDMSPSARRAADSDKTAARRLGNRRRTAV